MISRRRSGEPLGLWTIGVLLAFIGLLVVIVLWITGAAVTRNAELGLFALAFLALLL